MAPALQILAVDADPISQRELAQGFRRAGMVLRYVQDAQKISGTLKLFQASLLLVHAELGSPECNAALNEVLGNVATASLPIVLLCSDTSDARFARRLQSGIVEMLAQPFRTSDVERLSALWSELPRRAGKIVGKGDIAAFVSHIRKAQRSGAWVVEVGTPRQTRVMFARGATKGADQSPSSAGDPLPGLLARGAVDWTFTEVSGNSGDGANAVIELGAVDLEEIQIIDEGEPADDEGVEVLLDAVVVEEEPVARAQPPPSPPEPETPSGRDWVKLLLVDDDAELCRMFSLLFRKHGFQVTTASDGIEGYETAVREPFEAVIADLSMPRMDGWGLLRQLRDDFRTRELPVAFLSCHDDFRESLRALNAGAQAYFSKTTRLDTLVKNIDALLQARRAFHREVEAGRTARVAPGSIGPQWVLTELNRQRATIRVEAKDTWASYELELRDGELVSAHAHSGQYRAEGEAALHAFIASAGAEGTASFSPPRHPDNLTQPFAIQMARATSALNERDRLAREAMLIGSGALQVNAELYALYTQFGPETSLETARLICVERLGPREVLSRSEASPLEVEETLRDLVRRGVVTLSRPNSATP